VAGGPDKSFAKSPARYSSSPTGEHVPQTNRPGVPQRAASVAAEAVCFGNHPGQTISLYANPCLTHAMYL
jgi:hypothetical protein